MSDGEDVETGCVRIVNDVVFDFEEDPDEFIAPPLEILEEVGRGAAPAPEPKGRGRLRALVLTPTRELALQVKDHIEAAAKYTPVKVGRKIPFCATFRGINPLFFDRWRRWSEGWRHRSS